MLEITEKHLEILKQIKDRFLSETKVPKEDIWKSWTNNKIWIELIKQIMVVQSSANKIEEHFNKSRQSVVSFEKLIQIEDEDELQKKISQILDEVGIRFDRRKTKALIHNFKKLKNYKEGPKGLFSELSGFDDERRIKYLMREYSFIGSKGSRDYLMEAGFIRDAIAFDSRIINILKEVGIKLPKKFETSPKKYDEVEKNVLEKICRPLGLSGVEFDRMLFQNKDQILKMLR